MSKRDGHPWFHGEVIGFRVRNVNFVRKTKTRTFVKTSDPLRQYGQWREDSCEILEEAFGLGYTSVVWLIESLRNETQSFVKTQDDPG